MNDKQRKQAITYCLPNLTWVLGIKDCFFLALALAKLNPKAYS